jgi:hypothetical protein
MASQWPLIVDQLVTLLPALPGWAEVTVYDGRPTVPSPPLVYCTVGYVRLAAGDTDEQAGSFTKTRDPDGFQYVEVGDIRCQINTGMVGIDMPGQRAALFALADAIEASVRADRTLGGVLSPTSTLDLSVEVLAAINSGGTAASAVLTFLYSTVT